MKIDMHIILCVHPVWLQTHVSREIYKGLGMYVFLASVASAPHSLTLFARAVRYTHVYLACIEAHCVACS